MGLTELSRARASAKTTSCSASSSAVSSANDTSTRRWLAPLASSPSAPASSACERRATVSSDREASSQRPCRQHPTSRRARAHAAMTAPSGTRSAGLFVSEAQHSSRLSPRRKTCAAGTKAAHSKKEFAWGALHSNPNAGRGEPPSATVKGLAPVTNSASTFSSTTSAPHLCGAMFAGRATNLGGTAL